MTKKQKTWLGIFLSMFIVPEVLFSFILSSILFLKGIDFPYLMSKLIGQKFFIDNQIFIFLAILIEIIGLSGLLKYNIKFNDSKSKKIISLIILILLLLLLIIFYGLFTMRHGVGF